MATWAAVYAPVRVAVVVASCERDRLFTTIEKAQIGFGDREFEPSAALLMHLMFAHDLGDIIYEVMGIFISHVSILLRRWVV